MLALSRLVPFYLIVDSLVNQCNGISVFLIRYLFLCIFCHTCYKQTRHKYPFFLFPSALCVRTKKHNLETNNDNNNFRESRTNSPQANRTIDIDVRNPFIAA